MIMKYKHFFFYWLALINNWTNSVNRIETLFWSNRKEAYKHCVDILIPTVTTLTELMI